jgi:hypothetical protein
MAMLIIINYGAMVGQLRSEWNLFDSIIIGFRPQ